MAPKRPFENPPPASSSEEEESESDADEEEVNGGSEGVVDDEEKSGDEEEEEEKEEEEEEEEDAADKQNKKPTTNKSIVANSLGSEDESGTESDSESNKTLPSPSVSDFTIKPIASKPMSDSVKPKKSASKRNSSPAPVTKVTTASKRTSESSIEGKDSKKKKLSNDEDVKKGSGIQRLWSEDDEVAILKGMIEYQSKNGADPYADMGAFHEFIKKNLHADVSKNQLQDKIRRLKKKYQVNAGKGENGEDPVFSKPHELKSFELSKKIWGTGAAAANGKRKASQSKVKNFSTLASPKSEVVGKKKESKPEVEKKKEPDVEINAELEKPYSSGIGFGAVKVPLQSCSQSNYLDELLMSQKFLSQPESATSIMKEALPLIGTAKANELKRKWNELQEEEFQLYLKRIELFQESGKLMLEAKKSFKS